MLAGTPDFEYHLHKFWSPTKTINFFRCLYLIEVKSVRSISYDFFW